MRRLAPLILLFALAGCSAANQMLGGNSAAEAKAKVTWPYAKEGILIEVVADDMLNQYGGSPHTLVLSVFQVEEAKSFIGLLAKPDVLAQVLESGKADKDVLALNRYVVTPGARRILPVDRVQGAKMVGLLAAYYQYDTTRDARLFAIPIAVDSSGMFVKTRTAAPAVLGLRLVLGADQLRAAEAVNEYAQEEVMTGGDVGPPSKTPKTSGITLQDLDSASSTAQSIKQLGN